MAGTLILCATPIGNLGDATARLAAALREADVVYAEDTRRARTLFDHLGVSVDPRSYFVGNEAERAAELASHLVSGLTVALITDAGTPGVADPGLSAVRAAIEIGARVSGVPGPSAVTLALAVSGFPADRFVFEGFLPRRGAERSERIAAIASEARTVVLFASPNRLVADLTAIAAAHARPRQLVVARELTKLHEEVWRGSLEEAVNHWAERDRIKGEVTLVLGTTSLPGPDPADAERRARELIEGGMSPSHAVKLVANETGVARRELYRRIIG